MLLSALNAAVLVNTIESVSQSVSQDSYQAGPHEQYKNILCSPCDTINLNSNLVIQSVKTVIKRGPDTQYKSIHCSPCDTINLNSNRVTQPVSQSRQL